MTNSPTDLKLAILLNTLGHEAADAALSGLPAERTAAVRQHLEEFEVEQPSLQAIEAALDEFEVFLNFAVDTLQLPARIAPSALDSGFGGRPQPPKTELKIFEPTDDPFYDLNRLNPGQIAAALAQERPKTISIVLSQLDRQLVAATIDLLPEQMQSEVFMLLKTAERPQADLIQRVARKIVEKAAAAEPLKTDEPDADEKLAQLLRELPKKTRSRLVDEIQAKDEATAQRLQDLLYLFEDIVLYDNRSAQKILGAIETPTLVKALQDADDAVHNKIFDNLSKRASETLKEELTYATKISEEEVLAARQEIAKTIGQLDSAGEITPE